MKEITKNQIISFESLRGIAAIAVAMAHFSSSSLPGTIQNIIEPWV